MRGIVTEGRCRCRCTNSVCLVRVKEGTLICMSLCSKVDPLRASGGSRGGDPGFFFLFSPARSCQLYYLILVCKSVDIFLVRSPRFSLRAMALCSLWVRVIVCSCLSGKLRGFLGRELGGGLYGVGVGLRVGYV